MIILMVAKFRKNKRSFGGNWFFPVFLSVLLLVIIGFLAVSNFKIIQKRSELNEQEEYLREQLRILEERNDLLQAQASDSADEDYLETEARERFNLKKPGESVVTILPPEGEEIPKTERQWWNPFTW